MEGKDNQKQHRYVPPPPDFREGGREYRRNLLLSTSFSVVLLLSSSAKPEILGINVPEHVMWLLLGVAHIYFFVMWRLTALVTDDMADKFWNIKGLATQALKQGTRESPGKVKAQCFFIRSLPIWAFLVGIVSLSLGLCKALV